MAKLTIEQREAKYREVAGAVVEKMAKARARDDGCRSRGESPLNRFMIKNDVELACRRVYLHEALLEKGILDELAFWIFDRKRQELGPVDLRTSALNLLLLFDVENNSSLHLQARRPTKELASESVFHGISKEHLEHSCIGYVINKIRSHDEETTANRNKACELLQRFSRAFLGIPDGGEAEVNWKCKGDASVLPPFAQVRTASEAFQAATVSVDPMDPMSYLRVPPPRFKPAMAMGLTKPR